MPSDDSETLFGRLPVDSPERRRLPPLLRRAWYSLNQAFRRRLAHLSLTPDQFTVLRTLHEHSADGLTQRQLAHAITSDPNTIAALAERMEQAGWITRERDRTDGRARRLRLCEAGRHQYEAARSIAVTLQQDVLATLPSERREAFLGDLAEIAEACRRAAAGSPKGASSELQAPSDPTTR